LSIKAKISLDSSELKKGLNQAEQSVKKAGKEMNSATEKLDKFGDNADRAVRAIDSVGGALGQTSTGISGLAGDLIDLVKNPMSAVIAAFGLLVAVGVKVWDKLTESAEEYNKRLERMAQYAKERSEKIIQEQKDEEEYIQVLKDLAQHEKLSNLEKIVAITLVDELTKKYGNLGISIDKATGKIIGLDEAFESLLNRQRNEKIKALEEEVKIAQRQAHVRASQMTGSLQITRIKNSGGRTDTTEGEVSQDYKDLTQARNMGYDVKLNTRDKRKWSWASNYSGNFGENDADPEQLRLNKLWNEGGLEGKLRFAQEMQNRAGVREDQEKVKMYQDLAAHLQVLIDKEKELARIRKYGTTDPKEWLKKTTAVTEGIRQDQTQAEAEKTRIIDDWNKGVDQRNYNDLESDLDKIIWKEKELKGVVQQRKDVESKIQALKKQLADNDRLQESAKGIKDEFARNERIYQLTVKRREILAEMSGLEIQRERILTNEMTIEEQIADLHQRSKDFYKDKIDALNEEIVLANLKLKGADDEITKQKIINELKAKGLKIDMAQIDAIIAKQKQLGGIKLQDYFKDQNESIDIQAKRRNGNEREALRLEVLRNAERIKGSKLTAEEIKIAERLADRQWRLRTNKPVDIPKPSQGKGSKTDSQNDTPEKQVVEYKQTLNIRGELTNELARRGGFTSSVVSDPSRSINQQLLQIQKSQNNILTGIRDDIKNVGVIR
jgi:hypothetical protein